MLRTLMLSAFAMAVLWAQNESRPAIQKTPAGQTSVSSGKEMYHSYCAACHGVEGKGDGPASGALKFRPSDLTTLTKRNAGKFPELRVFGAINGDLRVTAHGPKDMPTWGAVFRQMEGGDVAGAKLRIRNLTKYIESLQVK
ncbi:MAG TPA: cytochrome c [Bryobacteraceae bacterium]|nr:cytochrome c [Bryobacteraceae bacterium]